LSESENTFLLYFGPLSVDSDHSVRWFSHKKGNRWFSHVKGVRWFSHVRGNRWFSHVKCVRWFSHMRDSVV